MGGTSFEACLLPASEPAFTNLEELEYGVPIALTMVDARAIGAGGGSLAWVDAAGILKVGPQSAGADPGPACYGRGGTEPTVTDANVHLGRLTADFLLAGDLALDADAAARALEPLAERLGLSPRAGCPGDRGRRQQQHGAGAATRLDRPGLRHARLDARGLRGRRPAARAASSRRRCRSSTVLVPRYPGAFSAFGALLADTRFDYTQTSWMRLRQLDLERANDLFASLERRAAEDFRHEGFTEAPRLVRSIDVRYVGQNWELTVAMPGGELTPGRLRAAPRRRFEEEHERFYGYSIPGEELELLTFNVAAVGTRHTVELPRIEPGPAPEPIARRPVVFSADDGPVETAVYRRENLPAGVELAGPAIVGQVDATTLLPPGAVARVDEYANLLIRSEGAA